MCAFTFTTFICSASRLIWIFWSIEKIAKIPTDTHFRKEEEDLSIWMIERIIFLVSICLLLHKNFLFDWKTRKKNAERRKPHCPCLYCTCVQFQAHHLLSNPILFLIANNYRRLPVFVICLLQFGPNGLIVFLLSNCFLHIANETLTFFR